MPTSKIGPPIAPTILARVPLSVIRALDIDFLLTHAVSSPSPTGYLAPILAFSSLEEYLHAARLQQRRIKVARAAIARGIRSHRILRTNIFNEVHFYLICWARIAKLGRFIADKTRFKRVGLVLRRHHAELKPRVDFRDHLEHFEERLPGSAKKRKLPVPNDLFNAGNDHVTFGGHKLDVGPASMRLLSNIVAELHTAIVFDAVEAISATDRDQILFLIQRAASHNSIAKFTRTIQKRWQHQDQQTGA